MMTWNMIFFPDSNSPIMEQLIFFHDYSMLIILMIMLYIIYFMIYLVKNKIFNMFMEENQMIESIWTIIPMIILIFMAVPSLRLLYLMEENFKPLLTVKILGHQWYWSYGYSNFFINFDSFMIAESDLQNNNFRLIEVDNRLFLPYNLNIRLILTSYDVIHAWTVPSLGVKMDAIPGRLNQMNIFMNRPGLYYGQCSEICGANHSFMPIVIESLKINKFLLKLKNLK